MRDDERYDGLPGLERFRGELRAGAERRRRQSWLGRNRLRLGLGGTLALLAAAISPLGPAYGLLEPEYSHAADLALVEEWDCAKAHGFSDAQGTFADDCRDIPDEVASIASERALDGGVGRWEVGFLDGEATYAFRSDQVFSIVPSSIQIDGFDPVPDRGERGERIVLYEAPATGATGPTGRTGFSKPVPRPAHGSDGPIYGSAAGPRFGQKGHSSKRTQSPASSSSTIQRSR